MSEVKLYFSPAWLKHNRKYLEKMFPGVEIVETQRLPEAVDFRKQDAVRANYDLRSRKLAQRH